MALCCNRATWSPPLPIIAMVEGPPQEQPPQSAGAAAAANPLKDLVTGLWLSSKRDRVDLWTAANTFLKEDPQRLQDGQIKALAK